MLKTKLFIIVYVMIILMVAISLLYAQDSKPRYAPNALPGVEPEMLTPEEAMSAFVGGDSLTLKPSSWMKTDQRGRFE